ncbi:MAG: hypothetical protein IH623_10215 [Verrucomicrobia bacterium]|nr:hypothetical protein [Verrucomicrobiota bacterium]
MTFNLTNPPIEVEAKFLGGYAEFGRILSWLSGQKGFECVRKAVVHRIHVYFDDGSRLKEIGCRFRCVIAPGEWCRYDFKADDNSGATLEVSIKKDMPAALPEVIDQLVEKVPEGEARQRLADVRATARMVLALVGKHQKALLRGPALELEVSWDVLSSLESGATISEVEVELVSGERRDFENCAALMAHEVKLERVYESKLDRLLGASAHKTIT